MTFIAILSPTLHLNMSTPLEVFLRMNGRVASLQELQTLVMTFEEILKDNGIGIRPRSQLERACLSVIKVLGEHQGTEFRAGDDILQVYRDVLGIWSLLTLIVRRKNHPAFAQFVPHLKILNQGTVSQNSRLLVSDEASNKIFELFFALVLVDIGSDLVLDHPSLATGDNPDILITIDSRRWGFAFKTLYSISSKTFFDNLRTGTRQIEVSEAQVGCVTVNFRNLIEHSQFMPIMNPEEHAKGADPDYGCYDDPMYIRYLIGSAVRKKEMDVRGDIGDENILNLFAGKKALPGFAAFFQTCAKKLTFGGPVPSDICSLGIAPMNDWAENIAVFERINEALHHRATTSQTCAG